jgi:hypothetical protein
MAGQRGSAGVRQRSLIYVGFGDQHEAMMSLKKAYDVRFRASILLRPVFNPTLDFGNSCATSASRKPRRTWHCPDPSSVSPKRPFQVEQNVSVFRLWHRPAPVKCAALDDTVCRAVIAEVARIAAWIRVGLRRSLSGASDRGWCRAASRSSHRYDTQGAGENSSKCHDGVPVYLAGRAWPVGRGFDLERAYLR